MEYQTKSHRLMAKILNKIREASRLTLEEYFQHETI